MALLVGSFTEYSSKVAIDVTDRRRLKPVLIKLLAALLLVVVLIMNLRRMTVDTEFSEDFTLNSLHAQCVTALQRTRISF